MLSDTLTIRNEQKDPRRPSHAGTLHGGLARERRSTGRGSREEITREVNDSNGSKSTITNIYTTIKVVQLKLSP